MLSITCPVFEARLLHASSPKLLDVCVKEDGDLRDFAGRAPLPAWAPQVTRVLQPTFSSPAGWLQGLTC